MARSHHENNGQFQVSEETMFLPDNRNIAAFPLGNRDFPVGNVDFLVEERMTCTHFEVNGDGLGASPTVSESPCDNVLALGQSPSTSVARVTSRDGSYLLNGCRRRHLE